jgi:multidrug efflux pump subunit AcrA (membrane-fusion protein)
LVLLKRLNAYAPHSLHNFHVTHRCTCITSRFRLVAPTKIDPMLLILLKRAFELNRPMAWSWPWSLVFVASMTVGCAPESNQPLSTAASAPNQHVTPLNPAPPTTTSNAAAARFPLEGVCEVKPRTLVQIKSQANGEVTAVRVDVGDKVRKGQVLVEISPRALDEQMQRNELARERVQKRIELLSLQVATQRREAKVQEPLYSEAGNAKALLSVRERETDLESAKIELRELDLRRSELARELRYTQLQSPGAGVIVRRTVEPGQIVNAAGSGISGGDGLLDLADTQELQLDCAVHAEDADLIAQRVPLVVLLSRTTGATAPVAVLRVSPLIDARGQVPQLRFTASFEAAVPQSVLLGARYPLNERNKSSQTTRPSTVDPGKAGSSTK